MKRNQHLLAFQQIFPEKMPPTLEKYDRLTDLDDHLRSPKPWLFIFRMIRYGVGCFLKGEALAWLNALPRNTVNNFETIRKCVQQSSRFNISISSEH